MRVRLWLTPILGLTLIVLIALCDRQELSAQYPPAPYGGPAMTPAGPGSHTEQPKRLPAERGTLFSAFQQDEPAAAAASVIPSGFPGGVLDGGANPYAAGMQPYPRISPFDYRFDQTNNVDGLWHRFASNQQRRYFATFQYMKTRTRHAKGRVGNPKAPNYKDVYLPWLSVTDGVDEGAEIADEFQGDATFIDGPGQFPRLGLRNFNLFNTRFGSYAANIKSDGFRAASGYSEADGSGLTFDVWYSGEKGSVLDMRDLTYRGRLGNGVMGGRGQTTHLEAGLFDHIISAGPDAFIVNAGPASVLTPEVIARNLFNLGGIPVDDGTLVVLSDGTTIGGTAIAYDLNFRLRNTSESMGTSLNLISTRSFRREFFKIHFAFGARYVYLNESFRFDGEDSGLAYDGAEADEDELFPRGKLHSIPNFADDDGDFIVDNAVIFENTLMGGGGGGGTQERRLVNLSAIAQIAGTEHPGRYQAFLESKVRTHLTGPEVGFNYSLGDDDGFRLLGYTKVGLMANFEKVSLKGNNIGDANNIGSLPSLQADIRNSTDNIILTDNLDDLLTIPLAGVVDSPIITPTNDNPHPNAFASQNTTAHVSPLLEQRVTAEMPIFRYVPILKRWDTLQDAALTAGWSVIWIGEVARPSQSIVWRANPREGLFPSIQIHRSDWWMMNWNVGLTIPF